MKFNIEIKKRQMYFLTALIVLGFTILFVQGQGVSNFGHDSNQVEILVGGSTMTLQEAYDTDAFNEVRCMNKRTDKYNKDAVGWCTSDYPVLMHCSLVDNEAPLATPTKISTAGSSSGICQSDGICKANDIRGDLATDDANLEVVVKDDGVTQGCWQYDRSHSRQKYRLEMVCCK